MTAKQAEEKAEVKRVETAEELEAQVEIASLKELRDAFRAGQYNDLAKLGKDTLAVLTRKRATSNAAMKTRFIIAKTLAADKDQLASYVGATTPEIRKALTGK